MAITVTIPSHLQPFVEEELASGIFADEVDLVAKALELYRETKARHADLRADVRRSLAEARQGNVEPLDMLAIKSRLA